MTLARRIASRAAGLVLAAVTTAGPAVAAQAASDECQNAPSMPHRPPGARCLFFMAVPAPSAPTRWGPMLMASQAMDPSFPLGTPVLSLQLTDDLTPTGGRAPVPQSSERVSGSRAPQTQGQAGIPGRPLAANEFGGGIRPGGASATVYLSFWLEFNPDAGDPLGDLDLAVVLNARDLGGSVQLALMNLENDVLRPGLRVRGLPRSYAGSRNPVLAANLSPGALAPGWHRWEIVVTVNSAGEADGSISWWIDGAPAGRHSDIEICPGPEPAIEFIGWKTLIRRVRSNLAWYVRIASVYVGGLSSDDQIAIENNSVVTPGTDPARETVVLLDANGPWLGGATPCLNDRVIAVPFEVRRLDGSSVCAPKAGTTDPFADELLVFSVDDSMAYNVGSWTNLGGEVRTVVLGPPFVVPVSLWLLREFDDGTRVRDRAIGELETAIMLYNTERTGIAFSPAPIVHEIYGSTAIGDRCPVPTGTTMFDAGRINVYYVPTVTAPDGWGGYRGYNCEDPTGTTPEQRLAILVALDYNDATVLTHELGHALAQVHAGTTVINPDPDYSDMTEANVMWEGSSNRKTFTLGQAFRMNLDSRSALVTLGLRLGPTRTCENDWTNGDLNRRCPRMGLNQ